MDKRATKGAFSQFAEAAVSLANAETQRWKKDGGRIMGYFCASVPEEVFTAAGFLPFRMRGTGSPGTEQADAYFGSINCSFPRHCFNQALRGEFDFLDGIVLFNSCDNVRRVYDHWVRQMHTPFVHIMSVPRRAGDPQVDWYRRELEILIHKMKGQLGAEITDSDLREAIKLHNRSRRLQRDLYALRKSKAPPITGADTLAVTVAGTAMPKQRLNALLEDLLQELGGCVPQADYRARLMVVGGILDDPEYLRVIEGQGGLVVTDSSCFGARMFWTDIDEADRDPLQAIARYYVQERPSCPRVFGLYESRSALWWELIRDFKVDGVILERLAFCDNWGFEQFTIQNEFREREFPLLMLDREYVLGSVGQLRTRVQAFLETIGGRS